MPEHNFEEKLVNYIRRECKSFQDSLVWPLSLYCDFVAAERHSQLGAEQNNEDSNWRALTIPKMFSQASYLMFIKIL